MTCPLVAREPLENLANQSQPRGLVKFGIQRVVGAPQCFGRVFGMATFDQRIGELSGDRDALRQHRLARAKDREGLVIEALAPIFGGGGEQALLRFRPSSARQLKAGQALQQPGVVPLLVEDAAVLGDGALDPTLALRSGRRCQVFGSVVAKRAGQHAQRLVQPKLPVAVPRASKLRVA